MALLAGLANSFGSSIVIRKTRQYKKGILTMYICCVVALVFLSFFGLYLGLKPFYWLGVVIFGLFAIPILSTTVEATCESLYPIG